MSVHIWVKKKVIGRDKGVKRKRDWHCEENVVDVVTRRAENVEREIRKRGMKHCDVEVAQDKGGLRRFKIKPTEWDGEPKEGGIGNA